MKLSTKGRYGLRAIIDLATFSDKDQTVSLQSIAKRQNISESYLEQLVRLLKKAELVESVRGAGGGYRMARAPSEISVGDVLRALEGDLDAVNCLADGPHGGCEASDVCVTKYVWKEINESINHAVDNMMLNKLVEESKEKHSQAHCPNDTRQ